MSKRIIRSAGDIHEIIARIAAVFEVSHADVIGSDRSQNICFPRHIAMYCCRVLLNASYPEIGRAMGNRDHATVINGCENVNLIFKQDQAYAIKMNEFIKEWREKHER